MGSAIGWLLSVAAVGLMSGVPVGYLLQPSRFQGIAVASFPTWCVGTIILMVMLAAGTAGCLGGTATYPASLLDVRREAAAGATWTLFGSEIVGIATTMLGRVAGANIGRQSNPAPVRF